MVALGWEEDPKRLAFTFARYKFVAKMLNGAGRVLEVGCGDSTGTHIVAQHVSEVVAIDRDAELLATAPASPGVRWAVHDIVKEPFEDKWDAVFALDVLEHVHGEHEECFMRNIATTLKPNGTLIVGMPSLESQFYASGKSKRGHVNCKTEEGLRQTMQRFFHCVYMFGMNDETLHTGFGPMCHYRLALANTPRRN